MSFFNNNYLDILNSTFNNRLVYKKIISEEGIKKIKYLKYDSNSFKTQKFCPISQKKFKENDDIALLPCNHIFEPSGILFWLKNENPSCPVCRYEFDHIEVKINDPSSQTINDPSQNQNNMFEFTVDINNRNIPYNFNITSNLSQREFLNYLRHFYSTSNYYNTRSSYFNTHSSYHYNRSFGSSYLREYNNINNDVSNNLGGDISNNLGSDASNNLGSDASNNLGSDASNNLGSDASNNLGSDASNNLGGDISNNNINNNNRYNFSHIENEVINSLTNLYLRRQEERDLELALMNSLQDN